MTTFTELGDGDWIWICNWTWKKPHASEVKKKKAGKAKEESKVDLPRIAARVKGQPSESKLVATPLWGKICEKCSSDPSGEFAPATQPNTIEMLPGGISAGYGTPYPLKMQKSNLEGRQDMTDLEDLGVGELMHCLRQRYTAKPMLIYTYVGDIVIVANPMEDLGVTTDEYKDMYNNKKLGDPDLSPHIYALADSAYRCLMKTNGNQSIVISGESGAGKSESTKHVLEYLAYTAAQGHEKTDVNAQIIATSEVLEAFGNAKTKRNHNSSRFGKFVQIQFSQEGAIKGAEIVQYLLEKSRITEQETTERNYHIFYMMLVNLGADLDKYHLTKVEDYRYLIGPGGSNKGSWSTRPDMITPLGDDEKWPDFIEFCEKLGITAEVRDQIFQIMSAVLMLGQVEFKDPSSGTLVEIKNPDSVHQVAQMMQVKEDDLVLTLKRKRIMKAFKDFNAKQARANADGLAKAIYGAFFISIVEDKINPTIRTQESCSWIGVLDIFGFESFQDNCKDKKATWVETKNKFEQLCINLTNEQLQHFFYEALIPKQLQKYKEEGLTVGEIYWADNQPCLNIISKGKYSLLGLLDSVTKAAETNKKFQENPSLADEQWLIDVKGKYKGCEKNLLRAEGSRMSDPKDFISYMLRDLHKNKDKTDFCVYHYAGQVWYTVDGAVDRNNDKVSQDLIEVVSGSGNEWLSKLLASSGGKKATTVSHKFVSSLTQLEDKLQTTNPYFARCVKPNCIMKKGGYLEDHKVLDQLICAGMTAVIEMRKNGYPVERLPGDLADQFMVIEDDKEKLLAMSVADQCSYLCNLVEEKYKDEVQNEDNMRPWQVGHTKIFLKDEMFKALTKEKSLALKALKEKQRGVVMAIKAVYLWRAEQPVWKQKVKDYKKLKPILEKKRELIRGGMSPEEAEKEMEAQRKEMERKIEEDYKNEHFEPVKKALAGALEPVDNFIADIDTFLAHEHMQDPKENRQKWKKEVAGRREAFLAERKKAKELFDKFESDYHNDDLGDAATAAIAKLQALVNAEPEVMRKGIERREDEIENAEKMEAAEKEEARLEEERKKKEEADAKERERLEKIRKEREEASAKEAERKRKIEEERRRRREEKQRKLDEKRGRKQEKIDAQNKKRHEEEERAERQRQEKARLDAIDRRRMEHQRIREEKEEKRAKAATAALAGTKVKFEDMVCDVGYVGALPYEGSGIYVGISCPKESGVMNDGRVMGEEVFKCEPKRGKFVRPDTLHLLDMSMLQGETPENKIKAPDHVWVKGTEYVGTVQFRDKVHFAAGEWVGLVLDTPGTGRNNGMINGEYYFSCAEKSGVFARPSKLVRVEAFSDSYIKQQTDKYCDEHDLTSALDDSDESEEEEF